MFDGVGLYQNVQLKMTEGESSGRLLVWHRRAYNRPAAQRAAAGPGSRRDPLAIRGARGRVRCLLGKKEAN